MYTINTMKAWIGATGILVAMCTIPNHILGTRATDRRPVQDQTLHARVTGYGRAQVSAGYAVSCVALNSKRSVVNDDNTTKIVHTAVLSDG